MKKVTWMILLPVLGISLIFLPPAFAEFYKYIDKNGVVRFTDDLSLVPEDQREKAPEYYESKTQPAEKDKSSGEKALNDETLPDIEDISEEELKKMREDLTAERKLLDEEYKKLMEVRQKLARKKRVATTKYRAKERKKMRADLEKRIREYDAKRKAYQEKLKIYNQKVRAMEAEQNANALEE